MATFTLFDYTISVPSTTNLFFILGGKQSYSNLGSYGTNHPWNLYIYFDGTLINQAGGSGAVTDSPSLFAGVTGCGAGNHQITCTWASTDATISLSGVNLLVLSTYK